MKSIVRLLFTFITLFAVISSTAYAADDSPVLSRIKESGKLVLGTSGNMPLMSEKTMTGDLIGYDIDMATALAESMGVELVIKTIPFQELISALEDGDVDVVLSNHDCQS